MTVFQQVSDKYASLDADAVASSDDAGDQAAAKAFETSGQQKFKDNRRYGRGKSGQTSGKAGPRRRGSKWTGR